MNKAELKRKVTSLVRNTKSQEALEMIDRFVSYSTKSYTKIENTVSINLAALKNAKEQWISLIINNSTYNDIINKINFVILTILDDIEDDDDVSFS